MFKIFVRKDDGMQSLFRVDDSAWIPMSDGNADFEQYKMWCDEGNIADREEWSAE